jgi:hypothetical protein
MVHLDATICRTYYGRRHDIFDGFGRHAAPAWRVQMLRRTLFALLVGLGFSGLTVLAHHSVAATYDTDKKITLHGAVTQVDWKNPHVFYFIDVAYASGKVTNWAIEASTPNQLYRAGWRKDDVKIDDTVTLTDASPARNGSPKAAGGTLTLSSGRKVFSGSPAGDQ